MYCSSHKNYWNLLKKPVIWAKNRHKKSAAGIVNDISKKKIRKL
jgi:hypothetical protein